MSDSRANGDSDGRTPTIGHSALRFGAVGIVNNGTTYALFVLLTFLGVAPYLAVTVSYAVGMFISFFGNQRVTFKHAKRTKASVYRFLIVNAIGYALNLLLLWVFVTLWGWSAIPAQLVAIVIVAVNTFIVMRLWIFRAHSIPTQGIGTAVARD